MLKIIPLSAILSLFLFSCGNSTQENTDNKSDTSNNHVHTKNILLKKLNTQNQINKEEYKLLAEKSIKTQRPLPVYNEFESYYIVDTTKLDSIIILSLIHKDESCCQSLYYLTFSDLNENMIDNRLVATNGSDGDWSETDKVALTNESKTTVTKIITQQILDKETDEYDKTTRDSITVIHNITKEGMISSHTVDSTRTYIEKK